MNILIVGNGFDLSHYLPTKYDHFMVAMGAIENWDIANGEMSFDDLFRSLYEKEDYFFGYTKAMYKTDEIKISIEKINELQKQLKENVWYQYFSDHVREVKTWIDFETKIKDALITISHFFDAIENYQKENNFLNWQFLSALENKKHDFILSQKKIRILELFNLLEVKYSFYNNSTDVLSEEVSYADNWNSKNSSFPSNLIKEYKGYNEFLFSEASKNIHNALKEMKFLFSYYIELISFNSLSLGFLSPFENTIDRIYSFNYTSTFQNIYNDASQFYYLHGRVNEVGGINSKIILGISDLEVDLLKKYDFWGFTKYHQKLLFKTDYQFVDEFKNIKFEIKEKNNLIRDYWMARISNGAGSIDHIINETRRNHDENALNLSFLIWGHSLDVSDETYIKDIFSFNDDFDQGVRVIVYYFNESSNFDLLANLIYILKKEKVEKWMKNEWLKFEPNPNIAEINNIQPVELPKIAKA